MFYEAFIVFFFSLMQATVSTVLSLLLALPIAHFFYKFDFPGKKFFITLFSMLCIMPTKMVVLSVSLFYGAGGFLAIILAHLMLNVPFSLYIIHSTYAKFDTTFIWLAADAGASSWRCYKDIIFPLLRPTIVSIFLLLFLLHFSSFSIPLLLGGQLQHNTPEIMLYNMYSQGNNLYAFLFWLIRLMIILPLFFIHNKFALQKTKASSEPIPYGRSSYNPCAHSIWWLVYCVCMAVVILGPLVALLIRACDKKVFLFFSYIISGVFDSTIGTAVYRVIANSILLAIISGIGSVLIAFIIGAIEFKVKTRFGQALISFITIFAFIVGSIGCGIIFSMLSYGKVFSSFIIGVLAHIFLNYAFAYRIIRAQLVLYHPDLHKTAQSCGATFKESIWTVGLPFVLPAIYKAFCVSFGLSLTEVGAGAVLKGKIGLTLPMAIRIYRKVGNQEAVICLSVILLFLVLLVTYFFAHKQV